MRVFSAYRDLSGLWGRALRHLPPGRAPLPRVGYLLLTRRCNIACSMCFLKAQPGRSVPPPAEPELTGAEWVRLIHGLPVPALLSLSGGEPLLHPDFHDIFTVAAARGPVCLETNASRIDATEARWLLTAARPRVPGWGLAVVSVSIHGPQEAHDRITGRAGTFAAAAEGVRQLARARGRRRLPRLAIRAVIQAGNVADLPRLPDLVRDLGADELVLSVQGSAPDVMDYAGPSGCGSPSLPDPVPAEVLAPALTAALGSAVVPVEVNPWATADEVVALYGGVWDPAAHDCVFPWTRFIISPRGDLGVCPHVWVGDLRTVAFREAWRSAAAARHRRFLRAARQLPPACAGCCSRVRRAGG